MAYCCLSSSTWRLEVFVGYGGSPSQVSSLIVQVGQSAVDRVGQSAVDQPPIISIPSTGYRRSVVRTSQVATLLIAVVLLSACGGQIVSPDTLGTNAIETLGPTGTSASPATTNIAFPETTSTAALGSTSISAAVSTGTLRVLEIAVWDDTVNNSTGATEVWVDGYGSWFPDLTYGADSRELGEFQVGVEADFLVYPDGRGGTEIRVPFLMTEEIISGSDRDMISVSIEDEKVGVFGTPIAGLEIEFTR